jgi:hypothetical protein
MLGSVGLLGLAWLGFLSKLGFRTWLDYLAGNGSFAELLGSSGLGFWDCLAWAFGLGSGSVL